MAKKLDKNTILFILESRPKKKDLKTGKTLYVTDILTIFSHFNYSDDLVKKFLREKKYTPMVIHNAIKRIHKSLEDNKIDISTYQRTKPKRGERKKEETGAKATVKKLSQILDVFNINKDNLGGALQSIREGTALSEEAILESYKVLYTLLMAQARGEIVTKKTSASYKLTEQKDGSLKKELVENEKGEKRVWEETQSHLPDGKAFITAMVVMEVIERMEQGDRAYATNDELNDLYAEYTAGVERERLSFKDKEYTDAELVEEEDEDE